MIKNPTEYNDVKDIITQTILTYDVKDIIRILSAETPLGTIIPIDHIKSLEIEEAINSILINQDLGLLETLHFILKEYIENKIRIFINIANNNIVQINKDYLWAEKYYLDMFGLWSPRLILIMRDKKRGSLIEYYEYNFNRYTYCPMWAEEINEEKCTNCLLNNNQYCKYNNTI